jgi:catechol 2,3-dioxygenase-like lactoylglutathione lyase family enzyme
MRVQRLDHVNVQTHDLEATRRFYVDVIGLRVGERPPFGFAGLWLYDDAIPVIHVNELGPGDAPGRGSGVVDHIAFRVEGLAAMRERVRRLGVSAREYLVPRNGDLQIFLTDPNGLKIELTFAGAEVRADASHRAEPAAISPA